MSDETAARARVAKHRTISAVWLVPFVALVIGLWMAFETLNKKGPAITLTMNTAEGVEAGKTQIKMRNVKVGLVTQVKLSDDYSHIQVTAEMDRYAAQMLRDDSLFWVVKPRIGREGVSGLDTLLSGPYIQIQPGTAATARHSFQVLEQPPVAPPDADGLRVVLTHAEAGQLDVSDPVFYQGFTVGRVERVKFDVKTQLAQYHLFIFQPYDGLVHTHTQFWITSGFDLQLDADGLNLHVDSLESLLAGGVSFGVPEGDIAGDVVTEQLTQFQLYNDKQQITDGLYNQYVEYVMLFEDSVRGLKAGAPVEYRGIRIGTVQRVPLRKPSSDDDFAKTEIPVLIRIEFGRMFDDYRVESVAAFKDKFSHEFRRGLKATLKTGNLITGALYVETDYDFEKPQPYRNMQSIYGYDIFPTRHGGFAEVQRQVTDLLKKLNKLPVEQTVQALQQSLQGVERTAEAIETAVLNLDQLMLQADTQALPRELTQSLQHMQRTLDGLSPQSALYQELQATVEQLTGVMTELQPLIRQVNDKPNSLVFGSDRVQDPSPLRKHSQE